MNDPNRPHRTRHETDLEYVVRTTKEIEYCLSKGTAKIDLETLAEEEQLPDLYQLIEFYKDYFESRPVYHRLHDMRHIRNRLVHQVGFNHIKKYNQINRISTRREYEQAYQLVKNDIPHAIERKKKAANSREAVLSGNPQSSGCLSMILVAGLMVCVLIIIL